MRFTNVRGNAAALGAGGTIIATLGVTAFASISVQSNQGAVGIILVGLITTFGDAITGLQCEDFWARIFNLMFYIPTFQRPSASLFIGARAR